MQQCPETIFLNGSVLTVDSGDRECEAAAVCGNRISFVGTTAEARRRTGPGDTVIDLSGRTLLPGFNDAHTHFGSAGSARLRAYVGYPEVRSIDDIKKVVAEWTAKIPKGGWIVGRGWDETKYPDRRRPTRWDLDEMAPDHFVFLTRTCGHMSIVNSRVLAAEGIDRNTPDPRGGMIERDSKGEPTGLLLEHAHIPIRERTAPSADLLAQADHLVDRLFAGEPRHELKAGPGDLVRGFRRARGQDLFGHHRHHHLGPAFPDQAQRAVKIEEHVLEGNSGPDFADDLDGRAGKETRTRVPPLGRAVVLFEERRGRPARKLVGSHGRGPVKYIGGLFPSQRRDARGSSLPWARHWAPGPKM